MANLTAVQKRIEELNPLLLDIENKIAASTSQQDRTQLEGERSKLATEYNEKQAKEQELLAESQTLERYTSMFQTFVDSLNNQIAAQNTLINKLTIDTEQRIVLYKALEDSLEDGRAAGRRPQDQHAGQQGRQHRRRDDGRHRRRLAEAHRRPARTAREEHGRHGRHPAPQEARRRRLRAPLRRGPAQAQRVGLRAAVEISASACAPPPAELAACGVGCRMTAETDAAEQYFSTIAAALPGSRSSCATTARRSTGTASSPRSSASYIARLEKSFSCWRNRLGFVETFKISRAESGFPVFQNVLELENDRRQANQRLASIPEADEIRNEMADFILRHKEFPAALQTQMAERLYLEDVKDGNVFSPFMLAETAKVSVNPKTFRPYYLVHWATFDGSANLPLIYMATVEDSSEAMVAQLVGAGRQAQRQGRHPAAGRRTAQPRARPPLRRLHREELGLFAVAGDDRRQSRQGFRDAASQAAAPRRARAVLFGRHHREQFDGDRRCCPRCGRPENAWLLTWTIQEVFSKIERPGRKGLWSSEKATQEFFINTDDLEAARQGVSSYEKHALIPHEAYQALYAAGEAQKIFVGYKVHILSKGQVISDV